MANPFHSLPSFAEFKQTLAKDDQVEYIEGGQLQKDGDDPPHSLWYFKRLVDGEDRTYIFHNPGEDELISFHIIRSICKHFDIPFQKDNLYGLHLG